MYRATVKIKIEFSLQSDVQQIIMVIMTVSQYTEDRNYYHG